jgi:two-component system, LytTR family, sensor kinase
MENDKWARIIGIPLVSLLIPLFKDFEDMTTWNDNALQHIIACLVFTTTMWEGNRLIFIYMKKRFPGYKQTVKRITVQTAISIVYTILVATFLSFLLSFVFEGCTFDRPHVMGSIMTSIIPTFLVTSIYESVYFFQEWKKNIQQTEALAKETIISQFEVLKSQVDPHFLFNSLNTLAALIDEENEPAQKYLEQLSDVYRYVLISKDKTTVTLAEELAFLESYIYLNKTRFRDNLVVENSISAEYHKYMVAPLTLQMLVENAIKHNIISKEKPLTIRLSPGENEYISVENNIQEKTTMEKSTKVGLQNIINRYNFLTSKRIEILNNSELFTVRIPLLNG